MSKNIIADVRDVQSVVSLHNDDIGEEDVEGNIISIANYFDESSGKRVSTPLLLSLPGDAFRDQAYLDYILANKEDEELTSDDFNDLLYQ